MTISLATAMDVKEIAKRDAGPAEVENRSAAMGWGPDNKPILYPKPSTLTTIEKVTDATTVKRRTLWSIGDDLMALDDLLEEMEGEITDCEPIIDKWFAELANDLKGKMDGYAAYICELEARSESRKAESQRLGNRAKIDQNLADWLRERMRAFFTLRDIKKLETARYRLSLCGNGGKTPMKVDLPAEKLPDKYRKVKTVYEQDTDAIRKDLEAGVELEFARFLPKGNHVRIK